MDAQGTSLIDTSYFTELTAQINAIQGNAACAELQAAVNAAAASIQAELASVRAEIASLLPLITLPTSLGSVIAWISNFASPLIASHVNYVAQLAALLAAISALETAITNAAARLTSCSITIPPMV